MRLNVLHDFVANENAGVSGLGIDWLGVAYYTSHTDRSEAASRLAWPNPWCYNSRLHFQSPKSTQIFLITHNTKDPLKFKHSPLPVRQWILLRLDSSLTARFCRHHELSQGVLRVSSAGSDVHPRPSSPPKALLTPPAAFLSLAAPPPHAISGFVWVVSMALTRHLIVRFASFLEALEAKQTIAEF